ncbi:metalloregulator ArsR/SmtB family transcription factor [Planctomycetaceae bacterium]|jgi:DNA-binding transcriptional ArsR family regulator|nr:metalloregulator ArsR/SmtB family transcription factor [Planctomycetaceae bacterium]MDC0262360.1 metalloregulator ArsR/SmtB family transcription factor [Planctomycetaceae bacterium]MDC0307795.1 metalloregulator ArsR/SmtB family transcription factor [Planctomycetaceae bacterium]MDG2389792.1 metalloregulator ArsR/SmtB family transcription factor [Planctomycetaceae bacterium]
MIHSREIELDETFFALSDPTRRAILERLTAGQATVSELSEPFDISAPAISKHLRVLAKSGLLEQTKEGRHRICRLRAQPLQEVNEYVVRYRKFWDKQLDQLTDYLESLENSAPQQSFKQEPSS